MPSRAGDLGGARWEREQGFEDPDGDPTVTRNNGGAFVEARASVTNRAYLSGGIGVEHNEVFGNEAVPRFSAAVYLRQPSAGALGDTKVSFNVGKGIKAPNVGQQQNALFELVQGTPVAASVSPIGPEKSRGWDIALEQGFGGGQYRARIGYYNNEFENLIEFLNRTALVRAGVPADVAEATAFGAYINSQSFDAQGIELSADAVIRRVVRFGASYTYLDAEVTQAFGASAVTNPAFPECRSVRSRRSLATGRSVVRRTRARCSSATRMVRRQWRCRRTSRASATTARS